MLDVEFAQLTDIGKMRELDEDYVGYVKPETAEETRAQGWLFALADGVGGQDKGEVASRAAVEQVVAGFKSSAPGEPLPALLTRLVRNANQHVYELGRSLSPGGTNMATTIVTCAMRYDRLVVAHAGDSRCYLVRERQAALLTRDHTVANDQARLGLISSKDASNSANSHILTRSLGTALFLNVDVSEHQILPGDVVVQCCDGVHNSVETSEIAALVGGGRDLKAAARIMVSIANERDGSDNITVQLIRVRGVERVGMYRGRPYKLR
jgi:protein phosphatase